MNNWVANMVYPRWSAMIGDLRDAQKELEDYYAEDQKEVEAQVAQLTPSARVDYLTAKTEAYTDMMMKRWDKLAKFLIVKHNDHTPEGSYDEHIVVIAAGKEKIELKHVLIGEVWLASGQSNMEMPLRGFDGCPVEGALQEIATSGRYKGRIRFVMLPKTEAYEPLKTVDAPWKESCADNAAEFSATAWFFAKNLNEVLDVPVGIICNAWGGSAVEGWIPREIVRGYSDVVAEPEDVKKVRNQMARPTIMYYGQWCPVRDYTYKGVIWYQGESNPYRPYLW